MASPAQETHPTSSNLLYLGIVLILFFIPTLANAATKVSYFAEAPHFRNGDGCPAPGVSDVHIAMTLDHHYLRGSIAAIHSILKHASCPEDIHFHLIAAAAAESSHLHLALRSAFPSLRFRVYGFDEDRVRGLISPSTREALQNPLNYARAYLGDLLDPAVRRVIYLDSDVVVVDDIRRLWDIHVRSPSVVAAPEYCHADFTRYFTAAFWEGNRGAAVFEGRRRKPCYFNTGVMVMDLVRWREGGYRRRVEAWMRVQRGRRIYELGSLPPFLLVLAGDVQGVDHRWNQHGLGGDNVSGRCRKLHPGPVSLLHWSGRGKPWDRLDAGAPCPVDHLWAPYDLFRPSSPSSSAITSW